jgi:uracil-DNA glycosylase family 4
MATAARRLRSFLEPPAFAGARIRVYASLDDLHAGIDQCRVCGDFVKLRKPLGLKRGGVASVMIVGEGPGGSELKHGRAFAGGSGKTLDNWLVGCGAVASAPRKDIYITSIIKCVCPEKGPYQRMASECSDFLVAQISLVKPSLVISLGRRAYTNIQFGDDTYSHAIGRVYNSADFVLFTKFDHHFSFLPWPHPSGLNRQLNDSQVRRRVEASFGVVRAFLKNA